MSIVKAVTKTVGVAIIQHNHRKEQKKAQAKAYKQACKDARGKFDPYWRANYQRKLNQNLQKVDDKKERAITFFTSL